MAIYKNWPDRMIPANPADLNFEAELRSNTRQLLDAMKTFDIEFVDSVNALGGDSLADGILELKGSSDRSMNEVANAIKAENLTVSTSPTYYGSTDPYFAGTPVDQVLPGITVKGPFASIDHRFSYLDTILHDAFTESIIQPTTGTLAPNSIHARFSSAEQRLKDSEDLLKNAYTLDLEAGASFVSIEKRFQSGETRITALETELNDFTGADTLTVKMSDYYTKGDVDALVQSIVPSSSSSSSGSSSSVVNPIKYLASVNGANTWMDLPWVEDSSGNIIDTTTGNIIAPSLQALYDSWVPDVPFQTMQFFGEVKNSRYLSAGFNYFVAGNLYIPNGVTLTLNAGVMSPTYVPGATLIVQGHVLGNLSGIVVSSSTVCPPRLIVQNWSTTRSTYLVQENDGNGGSGILETSYMNLSGKHVFPAPLEIKGSAILNINTPCDLVFKNADAHTQGQVMIDVDSNNNPIGSITYMDEQLAQITAIQNLSQKVQDVGSGLMTLLQNLAGQSNNSFICGTSGNDIIVEYNKGQNSSIPIVTDPMIQSLVDDWQDLMESFDPSGAMSTSDAMIDNVANQMTNVFQLLEVQYNKYTVTESTLPDGDTELLYDFSISGQTPPTVPFADIHAWVADWKQLVKDMRDSIGSLEQLQLLIG